jgi:hypothetical protein
MGHFQFRLAKVGLTRGGSKQQSFGPHCAVGDVLPAAKPQLRPMTDKRTVDRVAPSVGSITSWAERQDSGDWIFGSIYDDERMLQLNDHQAL